MVSRLLDISRPECVDNDEWGAVQQHLNRLRRALDDADFALVVGTSKELAETTAKIICHRTGRQLTRSTKFDEAIAEAHRSVSRRSRQANDPAMSAGHEIATRCRKITTDVNKFRNDVGTGHGQRLVTDIDEADAIIAATTAVAWVRWAFAREGVATGLTLNGGGYIQLQPAHVGLVIDVLAPTPDRGAALLQQLLEDAMASEWSRHLPEDDRRQSVTNLRDAVDSVAINLRDTVGRLADRLEECLQ